MPGTVRGGLVLGIIVSTLISQKYTTPLTAPLIFVLTSPGGNLLHTKPPPDPGSSGYPTLSSQPRPSRPRDPGTASGITAEAVQDFSRNNAPGPSGPRTGLPSCTQSVHEPRHGSPLAENKSR